MHVATQTGALTSGSQFLIETPSSWNGVLLLCARPVPVAVGEPPWQERGPVLERLLKHGYALAASANTVFWPLERAFADQGDLLNTFDRLVRPPRRTIAWGISIGGIISAGLVQLMPEPYRARSRSAATSPARWRPTTASSTSRLSCERSSLPTRPWSW